MVTRHYKTTDSQYGYTQQQSYDLIGQIITGQRRTFLFHKCRNKKHRPYTICKKAYRKQKHREYLSIHICPDHCIFYKQQYRSQHTIKNHQYS